MVYVLLQPPDSTNLDLCDRNHDYFDLFFLNVCFYIQLCREKREVTIDMKFTPQTYLGLLIRSSINGI